MMLTIECKVVNSKVFFILDGEPWKMGDTAILGKQPLIPKTCDSLKELEEIYASLVYQGAKRYAYKKLAMKNMPSLALIKLLLSKHVPLDLSQKIVEEITQQGFINDENWAESFVRCQSQRKQGPKAILYKLQAKGYKDAKSVVLPIAEPKIQQEAILHIINTRYHMRNFLDHKERSKVIAALMRKGFDLEQILVVIKKVSANPENYQEVMF